LPESPDSITPRRRPRLLLLFACRNLFLIYTLIELNNRQEVAVPFTIKERFEVQAPVQLVWEYMIDPSRVVVCIPGAELIESQDERTFVGAVKVKVGPISSSFKGTVKFTELDEQTHQVKMIGEGRDTGGAGSAKVTMSSRVTQLPGGAVEVVVDADVDLVGKIVQFGRGMIEEVSRQLFRQFSACVKQQLELSGESSPPQPTAESGQKSVSAAPLAFRALWAVIVRSIKRLFGKQPG
jgi:carbon monoxide dehydrogenase subunit G